MCATKKLIQAMIMLLDGYFGSTEKFSSKYLQFAVIKVEGWWRDSFTVDVVCSNTNSINTKEVQ